MVNSKRISNNIESQLNIYFNKNGLKSKLNNTHGIDLIIKKSIYIEIKSCRKYTRHSGNIRSGLFSFKKNEFKQNIDYYIFVLKVNSMKNLDIIKKLDIFIIEKERVINMINKKSKLTHNRTCKTYTELKKIKHITLNDFLEKIKLL